MDVMSVYDLFYNTLFSVTTCRNYELPDAGLMRVADATPQPGLDSSLEESVEAREIMEESPETYAIMGYKSRNGSESDEAYEGEIEPMRAAITCAENSVDLEKFMSDIDTLSNETRTAFFSQYCPQLERTALCMHDVVEATRPFLEEDLFIIVKALADNYPDAVDMICKNDGEMIFNLAEPTTKKCVETLWDDVMEHMEPFADEVENWDISHLTQFQCEALSELRQYIEGKLNVCQAADLMSVYDLFYNTLFSVTTCRNYVTEVTEIENNTVNEN
ncbi:uncharacterized protein LOC131267127 isoform X1 [Anopheles coustani]|uniref:uncharacterized protein LOC131267127 isoform X1 n=1 Tax=Anopheles coustani TaxID=139045 RepID=UPI002659DF97|nr:uncharacterized protein LOC131267127 isoform X1 [Anopheles coustani]